MRSWNNMKLIVAGSRTFNDYAMLESCILDFVQERCYSLNDVVIVSGGAKGADQLGIRFAGRHDLPVSVFPALWGQYGKGAGMIRNKTMADNANHLIAFWDGVSAGTANMIEVAKKDGIVCKVVML